MTTVWVDTLLNLTVAVGAQGSIRLGFPTADISIAQRRLERFTLIRTILGFDLAPTVRDSGEGDQVVDMGIGVFSQEAISVGQFADPLAAGDFPARGWAWRARYRVYASAVDDQNVVRVRVEKDLKSRRKIESGGLMLVVDNQDNQGVSTTTTLTGLIRCLFLVG